MVVQKLNNLKLYKFIKIKIMNSTLLIGIFLVDPEWLIVLVVLLLMFGGKKIQN